MSDDYPLLVLEDVHAGYGSIEVLYGVDIALSPGQVFAILGPNGAGKSTTMKVCAGLLEPTSGEFRLAGRLVNGIPADELARRGVCTVPEGRGIFPNLTVRDNLLMMTQIGSHLAEVEEAAFARFPRLADHRDQLAGTLSGGEQQMLAMSRALASDPAVLLLDELSMGLAPIVVQELYEIVGSIAEEGVAVLIVEQFARFVLDVATEGAIILNGRIKMTGQPAELEAALEAVYLGTGK